MKTLSLKTSIALLALMLSIGFTSCKKNADTDQSVTTSETETTMDTDTSSTMASDTTTTDTTSTATPMVKKNAEDGTNSGT